MEEEELLRWCCSFSPHSGFVAIGNDKGRVLLYRLNHYMQA